MSRKSTKTDLVKLDALKDEDIDTSDIPELTPAAFANAKVIMPDSKESVTMRLDKDVLAWFRSQGSGYQTRINAMLRVAMEAQKQALSEKRTRKRR